MPGIDAAMDDLSKGNAQKIALAQAFLAPVDLLVLDEPRAALDTQAGSVLDELMAEARAAGAMVALSDPTPGPGYSDARRYQLVGGHLQPLDAGATATDGQVTIRLRPRSLAAVAKPLATFEALALSVRSDEGGVTLVVDADRCDAALRLALSNGWSVRDVQRHGEPWRPP